MLAPPLAELPGSSDGVPVETGDKGSSAEPPETSPEAPTSESQLPMPAADKVEILPALDEVVTSVLPTLEPEARPSRTGVADEDLTEDAGGVRVAPQPGLAGSVAQLVEAVRTWMTRRKR